MQGGLFACTALLAPPPPLPKPLEMCNAVTALSVPQMHSNRCLCTSVELADKATQSWSATYATCMGLPLRRHSCLMAAPIRPLSGYLAAGRFAACCLGALPVLIRSLKCLCRALP